MPVFILDTHNKTHNKWPSLYQRTHHPRLVELVQTFVTEDSSSRRIIRLVPVFTLETNDQADNECLPKLVQTDNAYSSIKTAYTVIFKEWIQLRKRSLKERYKTTPFLE